MEGVEFVGQSQHEAVVVIDHVKEALKTGLPSEKGKSFTAWTLDLSDMMSEGATWYRGR